MQARTAGLAGVLVGAALVSLVWAAHAHSGGGGQETPVSASPARVVQCNPGQTITARVAVTNATAEVTSYGLVVFWFTEAGAAFLNVPATTDPIQPGHTATITVGNQHDTEDWQPRMTCRVKVTAAN